VTLNKRKPEGYTRLILCVNVALWPTRCPRGIGLCAPPRFAERNIYNLIAMWVVADGAVAGSGTEAICFHKRITGNVILSANDRSIVAGSRCFEDC